MSDFFSANYINGNGGTLTTSQFQTAIELVRSIMYEMPGGGPEQALTLSSFTITPANTSGPNLVVDTQGAAATDDLKTIAATNCRNGHWLLVRSTSNSRTVRVYNAAGGAGQILTMDGAHVSLTDTRQFVLLKYKASTTSWEEVFRSQNIDTFPAANVTANYGFFGPTSGGAAKPTWRGMVFADFGTLLDYLLGVKPRSTLTVSSNAITPSRGLHLLDTSGGAVTLNTINSGSVRDGAILILGISSVSNAATITHNASAISLADSTNLTISALKQYLVLQLDGSVWKEIGRFGFTASGVVAGTAQGRLSLTSGTAVTTSDVTGAGTLYWVPFNGGQVATYNGSTWDLTTITEKSISLGTSKKWVNYDVFMVNGTNALELLEWKSVTASNNPAAGSAVAINVADTTGVAVGDIITVANTAHTTVELCEVTAFVTNTSVTVRTLANSYTGPKVYYRARATALTTQDGVYVKSGAATRLYLGTVRMTAGDGTSGGTCADAAATRFCWNNFNRRQKSLLGQDTTASWTYNTATIRAANANATDGQGRVSFICGLAEDMMYANYTQLITSFNSVAVAGIGLDSTTTFALQSNAMVIGNAGASGYMQGPYEGVPGIGYHFFSANEWNAGVGANTMVGWDSTNKRGSYLHGWGMF